MAVRTRARNSYARTGSRRVMCTLLAGGPPPRHAHAVFGAAIGEALPTARCSSSITAPFSPPQPLASGGSSTTAVVHRCPPPSPSKRTFGAEGRSGGPRSLVRAVVGGEGGPQPAVLNACTVKR